MKPNERNEFNVIIEGPDRTGKDTLIRNIKNHYNDTVFHTLHYSNVKQSTVKDHEVYSNRMYSQMMWFLHAAPNVICNRSHIGEMVYSPLYRDYSGEYVIDLEKDLQNRAGLNKTILITLIDSPQNLIDRDDGESYSNDLDQKTKEINLFKDATEKSTIKYKKVIDISDLNIDEVANAAFDFIDECLSVIKG